MSLLRERTDGIEVLRLDRPDKRNALDTATIRALVDVLTALREDDEVRVVVLSTTSTKGLCAGADVGEQLDAAGAPANVVRLSIGIEDPKDLIADLEQALAAAH